MENFIKQNFVDICVSHLGVGSYLELGTTSSVNADAFAALGIPMCAVCLSSSHASALNSIERVVVALPVMLPFQSSSYDFVIGNILFNEIMPESLQNLFAEIRRVSRKSTLLIFNRTNNIDRVFLEKIAFENGFRRHKGLLKLVTYEQLHADMIEIVLLLEVVPKVVERKWPLAILECERDLHMDMSRESGSRSDAHLVRYHKAANLVRPGDVVLDAACGLGYGSWILASTLAKNIFAIDRSKWAIDYATASFQSEKLTFQVGDLPVHLESFPSNQFDLIVSFETLEHLYDPKMFLAECRRILAPAGRIIVSVPHEWADETGVDPNPHHFDVYDWPKLKVLIEHYFLAESAVAQTADRAKVKGEWIPQNRGWTAIDPDLAALTTPAEWLIVVGMKHFRGSQLPPWSREWHAGGYPVTPPPVDYARMLENPWLSRALLDRGGRLSNARLLRLECEEIIRTSGPYDSAAALVVLCYQNLESSDRTGTQALIDAVVCWCLGVDEASDPHAIRWHVSLTFVAARLALKIGSINEAETWFESCAALNASLFSPVLITKTVESYYRLGLIRAADGRQLKAIEAWDNGLKQAEHALSMPLSVHFGANGTRLPFVLKEFGQICQWGQACADALEALTIHGLEEKNLPPSPVIVAALPIKTFKPSVECEGWKILEISNPNKWCKKINNHEFILHPNGFKLEEQPSLLVEISSNNLAQYLTFSAEAFSEDIKNGGVLLFVGSRNCADVDLRCWHLKPRKPFIITHLTEKPFEGIYHIRVLVGPLPNAPSSDYLGVRLKWIGVW